MINRIGNTATGAPQHDDIQRTATPRVAQDAASNIGDGQPAQEVRLSSFAQQLSDSAGRADKEYAGLSRKEMAAKADRLLAQITGTAYTASRDSRNAEVPDSADPERLARAADATRFVNGSGKNPFSALSGDRLALITYDDSGIYTTNERRAAWEASFDREYEWRKEAVANAMAEYNSTGKLTGFFSTVLEHFKTLSPIEQAQYPGDYEAKLQHWIDLDYNYLTSQVEGKGSPQAMPSLQESLDLLQA